MRRQGISSVLQGRTHLRGITGVQTRGYYQTAPPAQPSPSLVLVHRIKIEVLSVVVNFIGEGIMAHMVYCVKFKKEMPGLDEPPFDNDLGQKVYDNVSQEAWRMWMEHCKMLLNEYRLNPARREDQEVIVKQLEMFFFGEGSAKPKEYVPPTA